MASLTWSQPLLTLTQFNPLVNWQYQYVPFGGRIEILHRATAVGLVSTITNGSDTMQERAPVPAGGTAGSRGIALAKMPLAVAFMRPVRTAAGRVEKLENCSPRAVAGTRSRYWTVSSLLSMGPEGSEARAVRPRLPPTACSRLGVPAGCGAREAVRIWRLREASKCAVEVWASRSASWGSASAGTCTVSMGSTAPAGTEGVDQHPAQQQDQQDVLRPPDDVR